MKVKKSVNAAAHRLLKRAHEEAEQELMEKKSLRSPMNTVLMEVSMNLVCDCSCDHNPGINPAPITG